MGPGLQFGKSALEQGLANDGPRAKSCHLRVFTWGEIHTVHLISDTCFNGTSYTCTKLRGIWCICIYNVVQPSLSSFKTFSSRKRMPHPLSVITLIPRPPIPWQLLTCFLSLETCLFQIFHMKGFIRYLSLCDWPLYIAFSRCIHVAACIRTSFLFFMDE